MEFEKIHSDDSAQNGTWIGHGLEQDRQVHEPLKGRIHEAASAQKEKTG